MGLQKKEPPQRVGRGTKALFTLTSALPIHTKEGWFFHHYMKGGEEPLLQKGLQKHVSQMHEKSELAGHVN